MYGRTIVLPKDKFTPFPPLRAVRRMFWSTPSSKSNRMACCVGPEVGASFSVRAPGPPERVRPLSGTERVVMLKLDAEMWCMVYSNRFKSRERRNEECGASNR